MPVVEQAFFFFVPHCRTTMNLPLRRTLVRSGRYWTAIQKHSAVRRDEMQKSITDLSPLQRIRELFYPFA